MRGVAFGLGVGVVRLLGVSVFSISFPGWGVVLPSPSRCGVYFFVFSTELNLLNTVKQLH